MTETPTGWVSEQRARILVVYATAQHHTQVIAETIVAQLRVHGFVVEIGDARCGVMPPPEDYDGVVLGSPVGFGSDARLIAEYILHNRRGLAEVPAALFTVSTSGSAREVDPGGYLEQLVSAIGWAPDFAAAFAGGDPLPRIGKLVWFVRQMSSVGEQRTLHTSWTDVRQFADEVAKAVATAVVTERGEPDLADRQ